MNNNLPDKTMLNKSLYVLYNMEVNNYAMNRAIGSLNREIKKLGNPRNIPKPGFGCESYIYRNQADSLLKESNPDVDENGKVKPYKSTLGGMDGISYILPLLFMVIALIIVVVDAKNSTNGIILKVISVIVEGAIYGTIAFVVGYGLAWLLGLITGKAKRNDDNDTARRQYNYDMQLHDAAVERDNKRIEKELVRQSELVVQRDSLINRRKQSIAKLRQFYDMVGIENSFRNIIPIGYMYEFSRLGIATKLGGADGLYYLVKRELRADQMQCTLDTISKKLDIIIDQNSNIYREIRNTNSKCDQMILNTVNLIETTAKSNKKLESIRQNTSVAAYNSERVLEEQKFTNYMLIWNEIRNY